MTTHPAPAPIAAAIDRCMDTYSRPSIPHYRVLPLESGTAALQARRPHGAWLTLALGLPGPLAATAARMEADL